MLFLTGLNHYWTLRVPQSSYISSLKFLQLGVKRLPFWCNASLTEDKSASIPPSQRSRTHAERMEQPHPQFFPLKLKDPDIVKASSVRCDSPLTGGNKSACCTGRK